MDDGHSGRAVAVIFASRRTGADEEGYQSAAARMEALAAQPGFRGLESARDDDGFGLTVSWWADEASALAWRDQPEHAAARQAGRDRWYESYRVEVARVERSYAWSRPPGIGAPEAGA